MLVSPNIGKRVASLSLDSLLEMLSIIPPVFILLGLMDVWVPEETMMKHMGKNAGIKGGIFVFALGSFSAGPLYASFPIEAVFLSKDVSLTNVFLFIGAWSTTKIPMMLFEITQLGSKFAVIRFCLNLVGVIILTAIMEAATTKQETDAICEAACRQLGKNLLFLSMAKKGNYNRAPSQARFFKSINIGIQATYSRLNSTLSVGIFHMTRISLPAQCPRAL